MKSDFLLKTKGAERLYLEYAKPLPIIDYHNHLSVADIASDKRFEDLYELWLACDPYKHRLMRICGVDEHFITGDAAPYEKFERFCESFPLLAGNPVYDWARMELSGVFGINTVLTKDNARYVYDKCNEMLASREFSNNAILARFGIEYQSPVASILDDLSPFDGKHVAPSLRGDNLLDPTKELTEELSRRTGEQISDPDTYINAVSILLDRFSAAGCRVADHALDAGFFESDTDGKKTDLLSRLGVEYAKRGWTLLLHMDAKRKTSTRLARVAGPAGGYAAVGGGFETSAVCDLLNAMEERGGLPDTVLFPLNMSDQAPLAVMQGSFSENGVPSKVQLGPAWWWCDHTMGIENTLNAISSFGVLSQFIGMTTDSRSILSFVRHDYFRRILCSFVDRKNAESDWGLPFEMQGDIVRRISYENAKNKIKRS
ncbi:MAG: glucuronate isomerase [Clostridia bacterium]|nr:glucuronate isomerase [Clostridia bacterium]MBR2908620.1 glucuronate isomerase [Clostridia bacterium]